MPDWGALFGDTPAAEVAVWLFAAFIVVSLLIKVWPFLSKLVALGNALPSLTALPAFMARTDETLAAQTKTMAAHDLKISEIHHEVNYNNGSSVKDAVERVELGVKGLYDRVDASDAAADLLHKDIEDTRPHPPTIPFAPKE
ncbi:hypothetical protein D6T64_12165 [Cryobacterium melibiosiphilum]|uniref:DUF2746 domain-containing protein n=2 Tax=Cryobacterium melibiosiphilum TaxID=995039 RepID=A0A3A5MS24_9MICO|nr:hypothetical protein D6T64_12165 [Cryobacterium melibiosiphilum]